jgi:hypothetical protein
MHFSNHCYFGCRDGSAPSQGGLGDATIDILAEARITRSTICALHQGKRTTLATQA